MKKFITIILVLATIGGLSYGGWHIYNKYKTKYTKQASQQNQTNISPTSGGARDPSDDSKYLVIKEWGVRLPINPVVAGATYEISSDGTFFTLSTPRLKKLTQENPGCKEADNSVGVIRAKPGDDRFGSPWTEEQLSKVGKKLGNYYYLQEAKKPYCNNEGSISDDILNEILMIRKELAISANDIQLDK